jgi:hypothetical protein
MNDQPAAPAPRLAFVELWRPMWLGKEPRVFWRELLPPMDANLARDPLWWERSEWRVMNSEAATAIKALPNNYFTLDEYPGVTFCWRRFRDKQATERDRSDVRCLRLMGQKPYETEPTAQEVAELECGAQGHEFYSTLDEETRCRMCGARP